MSVITDWADDYTSADTNTPASSTAIPYPASGTNDLGAVLRDVKKVIREQSLDKAWSINSINATYVSSTTFNLASNLTATYPTSIAINLNLNGTYVYSHIVNLSYSAPNTLVTIGTSVATSNLTSVRFSVVVPGSTPAREGVGYATNIGSPLPWRVTQIGQFDFTNGETDTNIRFARAEYDNLYTILFQPVSSTGTINTSHYRITNVTKTTTGCTPTVAAATSGSPSPAATVRWEYCIVRIT